MESLRCRATTIYFGKAGEILESVLAGKVYTRKAILCDINTKRYCLPNLGGLEGFDEICIEAGERYKHIDTCKKVWKAMIDSNIDRHGVLVNVGGGVIGDLGGFCAATFMRGIEFIQVPTTLLAMVDASVGGKVGVDFEFVKNAVGVFSDPLAVIIDETFLGTLPKAELLSGFAEVVKHALIAEPSLWYYLTTLENIDQVAWHQILKPSVEIKRRIVELDPHEKGPRKLLNFGHTVGHALESYALARGDELKHGEAVAMGMICEVILSERIAGLSRQDSEAIIGFILRHFRPYLFENQAIEALLSWMKKDKKNRNKKIGFTLLRKPGEAIFDNFIEESEIVEALERYRNIAMNGGS